MSNLKNEIGPDSTFPEVTTFAAVLEWVKGKSKGRNPLSDQEWGFLDKVSPKFSHEQREEILQEIHYKINPRD